MSGKGSILWISGPKWWAELQRQLKCLTLNKPEETRGCVTALLLPWKALGITLVTIPLSCFSFVTLYLTINNFKKSKAQHRTAECGSHHNFLASLKAETWKGRCQQRPRAGPTPPRETQAGDHRARGRASLFPGSCSTTYGQKDCISLEYLGMAEPPTLPCSRSIALLPLPGALREQQGWRLRASLWFNPERNLEKPKKVNGSERLALNHQDQRPRKMSFA